MIPVIFILVAYSAYYAGTPLSLTKIKHLFCIFKDEETETEKVKYLSRKLNNWQVGN